MPGVAQLWLTQEELDALLRAAGSTSTKVTPRLWGNLAPKLKDARDSLGCPVPTRDLDKPCEEFRCTRFLGHEGPHYPAREEIA